MRRLILTLSFISLGLVSFAQFNDTASLNSYIRDNIKDKRPEKVTAEQIQTGMLGITNILSWFNSILKDSIATKPTVTAADLRYKPISYVPNWTSIIDKPTSFIPSPHTHTFSDVPGLDAAINGKEDAANKSTSITLGSSNSLYPSQLAVKTYVDNSITSNISNYIPLAQRGAVNGVATLGATGKIPATQLSLTTSDVPEGMALYFSNARVQSFGDTRYALLSRSLSVGAGLTGGGDLTADRSFNLDFSYLDDRYLSGYKQRTPVRVATTSNVALSGLSTQDGITLVAGDRVLVKNQTNPAENGIWIAGTTWSRASDFDQATAGEVEQGSQIFVQEGTANNKTGWSLSTSGTIAVGTTGLSFIQYAGANSYAAGSGLSLTGNTFAAQNGSSLWNANKLQNVGLSTTTPTTSQLLRYDGANWAPWTPNFLTGELDMVSQAKTVSVAAGTGISVTGGAQTVGNNPAFTVSLNTTTSNVPEGSNLYWTTARGDARYPLLASSYSNPSWLSSLPWSKITGTPTTLFGYGITDAALLTDVVTRTATTSNPTVRPVFTGDLNTVTGTDAFHVGAATNGPASGAPGYMLSFGNASTQSAYKAQALLSYNVEDGFFYRKGTNASWGDWFQAASRTWANATFAPITGSGNYVQNQAAGTQASSNFWLSGTGTAQSFRAYSTVGVGSHFLMYNGSIGTGTLRWGINNVGTEGGSNSGSELSFNAYSDAGTLINSPLRISRANGIVNMGYGFRGANASGISGTSTGNANISYLGFYENNGTTRQGYVGKGSGSSADIYLVSDNGNVALAPTGTGASPTLQVYPTGMSLNGGLFSLTNSTSNFINFNNVGAGAPTFTTTSPGTKIILSGGTTSSTVPSGIGIEGNHVWAAIAQFSPIQGFKWYGGTTPLARLGATGLFETAGQMRATGWYVDGVNNMKGPAAEIGFQNGNATIIGYDRTNGVYTPVVINGGSTGSNQRAFVIDGTGYKFSGLPTVGSLGTDASGYLVNTSGSFIQNQIAAAQGSAQSWISGAAISGQVGTSAATGNAQITFHNGSYMSSQANRRWVFYNTTTEAAGNVGNDFTLGRYDNTGGLLGNPFSINRSSGIVTLANGLVVNGNGVSSNNYTSASASDDINFNMPAGHNAYFNVGGSNKVTVSAEGILSVGISNPTTIRASPLQVQGSVWSTDAYILGISNAPIAEFGLTGTDDCFVRTMGTGDIKFQTSAGIIRATVNGSTGNFEVSNQLKIAGGSPGTGKVLTSDGSGLATWSSGNVKSIRSITASYTATPDDHTIINRATTGNPTVTLPSAAANVGREYEIVEEAANPTANGVIFSAITYKGNTYTNFNNATMSNLCPGGRIRVQSDGAAWVLIGGL